VRGKVVGAITGGLIMGASTTACPCSARRASVTLVKGAVLLAAVAHDVWTKRRTGVASR
jgi:putative multiple sugar transport system permease protein